MFMIRHIIKWTYSYDTYLSKNNSNRPNKNKCCNMSSSIINDDVYFTCNYYYCYFYFVSFLLCEVLRDVHLAAL